MKFGKIPEDASPPVREAYEIFLSADRSQKAYDRLTELYRITIAPDNMKISSILEAWLVDGGVERN